MKQLTTILIILLAFLQSNAQEHKRANIWYFGKYAGIDFNTSPPTALTDGKLNTWEGCSSICDTNGQLLFYTHGRTVWNKNHEVMENGSGLMGDISSTQAALIVHHSDNDSLYYIVTTPDAFEHNEGMRFSTVNIRKNGGLGTVINKNTILHPNSCEKVSAVNHQNGKDVWVVGHEWGSTRYYNYLLTKNGFLKCPVISNGKFLGESETSSQGEMKFSPSGKYIATCLYIPFEVEHGQFNNQLGTITKTKIYDNYVLPFSVQYSPNEKILYILEADDDIHQVNLDTDKKYTPFVPNSDKYTKRSLELTPSGQIVICIQDFNFLGSIENPNTFGSGVQLNYEKHDLISPRQGDFGLPDFNQSYFYHPAVDFSYSLDCYDNTIDLHISDTFNADSYQWTFYHVKRQRGIITNQTTKNYSYTFPYSGNYMITLIATEGVRRDTVIKELYIAPKIQRNFLGVDTFYCQGESFRKTLTVPGNMFCWQWLDNSLTDSLTIDSAGTYWLQVTNGSFCTVRDSLIVKERPLPDKPTISISHDTLFAQSQSAKKYFWYGNGQSLGEFEQIAVINKSGSYQVSILDSFGCSNSSDPFIVDMVIPAIVQIKIFPNPAMNYFNVALPQGDIYQLEVFSLEGKLIKKHTDLQGDNIYTLKSGDWSPSIYLLRITGTKGLNKTERILIINDP